MILFFLNFLKFVVFLNEISYIFYACIKIRFFYNVGVVMQIRPSFIQLHEPFFHYAEGLLNAAIIRQC